MEHTQGKWRDIGGSLSVKELKSAWFYSQSNIFKEARLQQWRDVTGCRRFTSDHRDQLDWCLPSTSTFEDCSLPSFLPSLSERKIFCWGRESSKQICRPMVGPFPHFLGHFEEVYVSIHFPTKMSTWKEPFSFSSVILESKTVDKHGQCKGGAPQSLK